MGCELKKPYFCKINTVLMMGRKCRKAQMSLLFCRLSNLSFFEALQHHKLACATVSKFFHKLCVLKVES